MDDASEYDHNDNISSESSDETASESSDETTSESSDETTSESNESSSSSDESNNSSNDKDGDNIIKWNYNSPKRKLKPFNDKPNTSFQAGSKFDPVDAFNLLFTEGLFELLCKQTNIYGQKKQGKNWIPINVDEMRKWIGINILMGYHKLPSLKHYWSTDSNFRVPTVCGAMSRNLFLKIFYNLHLADNDKMPSKSSKNYSKTYKVDKFLQILESNLKKNYTLSENISIDESMIKFKGRSSLKQYLPMKPIKRGFKIWTLADSKNGYVYSFSIYKGKDNERTTPLGEHIVKMLISPLEFSYRKVYFDNFFTSPILLQYLYEKGIYAAGTVRVNRKNMPKDFCQSTNLLGRGEFEWITSGNLVLYKWMDRKLVFLLSNFHDSNSYKIIQRKEKDATKKNVKCPQSIVDYNINMGGVDRADQRKESYSISRKSKRFWLRIFFNFISVSLSNAFIIYKDHTNSNITYLAFLSNVTTSLINGRETKKRRSPSTNSNKKKNRTLGRRISFDLPNEKEPHLPVFGNQARCAFCSTRKDPHRSVYHCSHCNRAFCMTSTRNCFYKYHKNIL